MVFLYTELAGYILSCIQELNNEAPFQFSSSYNFQIRDKNSFSEDQILTDVLKFSPDIVICSGWSDKTYNNICRHLTSKNIKTVVCFDNKWSGSLKQIIASLFSSFLVRNKFQFAWVPGNAQKKFAAKLGFKQSEIFTGFYCADTATWSAMYSDFKERKSKSFPKRFLYVGRYYDFKGVKELWDAFSIFNEEFPDWELLCAGTGSVAPVQHPKINHLGFVQPSELNDVIKQAGVFVLPSRFEPWGVVVHEMAAAGMPMILSNEVGAAEAFLVNGKNGFTFKNNNVSDLVETMKKIASLNENKLTEMGDYSHELSEKISLKTWVDSVHQIAIKT